MHVSGGRAEAYAGKLGFTLKNPVAAIGIHEEIIHLFASLYGLFQPSRDENRLLFMRACAEHILALMGVLPRFGGGVQFLQFVRARAAAVCRWMSACRVS